MAAIEVFLGRRGFQREGQRTGVLYQAMGQLRLTVAGHKKVCVETLSSFQDKGVTACNFTV